MDTEGGQPRNSPPTRNLGIEYGFYITYLHVTEQTHVCILYITMVMLLSCSPPAHLKILHETLVRVQGDSLSLRTRLTWQRDYSWQTFNSKHYILGCYEMFSAVHEFTVSRKIYLVGVRSRWMSRPPSPTFMKFESPVESSDITSDPSLFQA